MMGNVVELPPRRRKESARQDTGKSAEVILFLGVRYERWSDEVPSSGPPAPRPRAAGRRLKRQA